MLLRGGSSQEEGGVPTEIRRQRLNLKERRWKSTCIKKTIPTWDALGNSGLGGTCIALQGTE